MRHPSSSPKLVLLSPETGTAFPAESPAGTLARSPRERQGRIRLRHQPVGILRDVPTTKEVRTDDRACPLRLQSSAALEDVGPHSGSSLSRAGARIVARARPSITSLKEPRLYALQDLGWTDSHTTDFEPHAASGLMPARVAAQHRGAYVLFSRARRAARRHRRPALARGGRRRRSAGRRRLGRGRAAARGGGGDDPARLPAADEVLAQGRAQRRRGAGARRQRRRRLPRHVAERGLQPPPAGALHHDGVGERRPARDRADQDRPLSRLGAARARGRGDRVRRPRARDLEL